MKILCIPDPHCWYTTPGSEEDRITEYRACAQEIIKTAQEQQIDFSIVPGDLWVSNRPSPAQVLEIIRFLTALSCPIVIAGNHDVCAQGQPDFVQVLKSAMGINCTNTPYAFRANDTSFALIPFLKGVTDDQLLILLHAQIAQMPEAKYKIVVAHYATDISTYSSGEMAMGKEPLFRMADLEALPVDLVVLGHIHNPRILNDTPGQPQAKPIIIHTGALTRRDHGEAKDQRGFYIITLDTVPTIEFFPLPAREFVTIDPIKSLPQDWRKCKDAYVRFVWECTEEELKTADTSAWEKGGISEGAFYITGFSPKIQRAQRERSEGITEVTDPLQALRMWAQSRNTDELTISALTQEAERLLKEVTV